MATQCQKCNGSGRYHRGSVNSFCFACKGRGVIVRQRRPSIARIEQRLANLQDEKTRLLRTKAEDDLEYERLSLETARFFEPIRDICGRPSSVGVASLIIQRNLDSRRESVTAATKSLNALKLLGPLTKRRRAELSESLERLAKEIATLQAFPADLSPINDSLVRKELLHERRMRLQVIEHLVSGLQEELARAERQPEVKMHKLRLRAAVTERENREAVERFRSELPRTESCPYCSAVIVEFHLDHIVPLSYGGRPCRENLVWVCAPCNLRKKDLTLLEFTDKARLDYLVIVRRLQALGKRA